MECGLLRSWLLCGVWSVEVLVVVWSVMCVEVSVVWHVVCGRFQLCGMLYVGGFNCVACCMWEVSSVACCLWEVH